jgi:hypothetical protein
LAHAYTPGLRVAENTVVRKERRLPLLGEVLVKVGDRLPAETIVAKTELPGKVQTMNAANVLGIEPDEIERCLIVKPGDPVKEGQVVARAKSFFGLFKAKAQAPITGTLESFSDTTGQVLFREPPQPVQINAYLDGMVTKVFEKEGIEIESRGSFIQGIFGVGGETFGVIHMMVESPDRTLDESMIDGDLSGKILVGGSYVTLAAVWKAVKAGAKGVVAGGFSNMELKQLLGYEQGVAITGTEEFGLTLILTEGFGKINMAHKTFDLLRKNEGLKASISGATQIRAGVIRPEIIIAHPEQALVKETAEEVRGLEEGDIIRIIRAPYFGKLGKVSGLPSALQKLESEAMVRVLEVELENGDHVILPRANIERIED